MLKWHSVAAWLYYSLGLSYYLYKWFIALGVGGIALIPLLRPRPILFALLLVFGLVLIVGGIFVLLRITKKRHEVVNPLLDIIQLQDTYRVCADQQYEFKKDLTVRAKQAGVGGYTSRFRWTGSDTPRVVVEPDVLTASIAGPTDFEMDAVVVHFPRPLAKGEELHFTLILHMDDTDNIARPFLAKTIDDIYPNGLTMCAHLPQIPVRTTYAKYLSYRASIPVYEKPDPDPNSRDLSWRIKRPQIGRRYVLSWVFKCDGEA